MKVYYLIYQITNKSNGMIYIGKHKTKNKDDGYMGSGIRITRAIEKYGVDNFEKTILFECSSEDEMNKLEAEIVNEDFIARDDVYNISLGGSGGWDYVNKNHRNIGFIYVNTHKLNNKGKRISNELREKIIDSGVQNDPDKHANTSFVLADDCNSLLEISGGLKAICTNCSVSRLYPVFVFALLSFGGICCFLQTASLLREAKLSPKKYMLHKMILCSITSIVSYIIYLLLG